MTIESAVEEVWRRLGEPSDLQPLQGGVVNFGLVGAQQLRSAINDAQDVVATWIDGRVRRSRFRCLEDSFFFESRVLSGTFAAGQASPWRTLSLPVGVSGVGNRLKNFVLRVGSDDRRVLMSYTSLGLDYIMLDRNLTVDPSNVAFTLHQRIYEVDTASADSVVFGRRKLELTHVIDLEQGSELDLVAADDLGTSGAASVANPGSWSKRGGKIVFSTAPETVRSYEVKLIRYPLQCVAIGDTLEIPDAYQQAVLLRAEWWGYGMLQEPQMAYAKKRDFVEMMSQLRNEVDVESDYDMDYFRIRDR